MVTYCPFHTVIHPTPYPYLPCCIFNYISLYFFTFLISCIWLFFIRYLFDYQEPIPVENMVKVVCNYKQAYTQYGGLRPFGVAFLFAGWDKHHGFQLYQVSCLSVCLSGRLCVCVFAWLAGYPRVILLYCKTLCYQLIQFISLSFSYLFPLLFTQQ